MKVHRHFKSCVAVSVATLAVFVWIDPARAVDKYCYYDEPYCCVDPPGGACAKIPDATAEAPCENPVPCCTGTGQCSDDLVDADCCRALPNWYRPMGGTCANPGVSCPGPEFSSADGDGENFSPADYEYDQATTSSTGMWGLLIAALVVVPAVPIVVARRRAARRE
ncbi:MAG: hypothetical protein JSU86_09750 [Phycisphaerales bacterium]|nr:MAG: hypothetical protein JSU86_09750 [Phycisphaerales bacterium]